MRLSAVENRMMSDKVIRRVVRESGEWIER